MNKMLLAVAFAALTIPARVGLASDAPIRDHDRRVPRIEGVWMLEITLRNCASGEVAPVPTPIFPGINTFHQGGTMSEHGARSSPASRSFGQGIWKRIGRKTFESRWVWHRFDNGLFAGTQDVKATMALSDDGTSLSISTTATFTDVSGVVTPAGCSTQVGERVEF